MTDQISTLGLGVDSSEVLTASQVLRKFANEGKRAETAATALERATASMIGGLRGVGRGAQEIIKLATAQHSATTASQTLATEGAKVARSRTSAAEAYRKEADAVKQLVPAMVAAATAAKSVPLSLNGLQSDGLKQFNAELGQTTSQALRAANAVGAIPARSASVSFLRAPGGVTPTTGTPSLAGVSQLTASSTSATSAINGVTYAVKAQTAALAATSAAIKKTADEAQRLHSINTGIAGASGIARNFRPANVANFNVGDGASLSATAAALRQVAEQTERIRKYKPVNPFSQNAVTQLIAAGAATRDLGRHQEAQAKSAKRAAFENQQLSFQIHDFFVQVASGGSPLTALVQQGSQLSGTFGGTGNALKAVLALLTPFRLAVAGAAGAVGGLGYGMYSSAERIKQFKNAITLTGNFSGQTQGGFNALSERVAAGANSGISQARELSLALLQTGEVSEASLQRASTAAVLYQRATQKTTEAVTEDIVNLIRAPAEFAQKLDRQFHFLTTSQAEAIKKFEENGQATQALDVIYGALIQRMGSIQSNMGAIDQKVDSASKSWQRLRESVNSVFDEFNAGPTVEQRIERLTNKLNSLPTNGPVLRNATTRASVQQELDAAIGEKAEADRRAGFLAEEQRRQQRGKVAISLIDGYEKAGKASDILRQKTKELNDAFDSAEQNGVKISKQQRTDALAGVQKQYGNQSGISEASQVLRANLERDLKSIQDVFQRERDTFSFQNQYLQGQYQNGEISLREFFRNKRETAANVVQAEIEALEKERTRLEQYAKKTKDPSEKIQAQTQAGEISAQQARIRIEGGREQILINQGETNSFRALTEQISNYKASLLQLEGDEAGAAKIRALVAIENARKLASEASIRPGVGSIDVAGYARAIQLADQFAEVQRRAQILSTTSMTAQDALLLAAQSRGESLKDTESGLYVIRQRELEQLGALTQKAHELAEASTDPRIKQFAADLALQYAKAAAAVDPALNRLRETTKQLSADLARTVADLPQTFADAYSKRRADAFNDIQNQKDEYSRRIDILEGYLAQSQDKQDKARLRAKIKDLEEQKKNVKAESKSNALFGALGDSFLKPTANTFTAAVNKVLIEEPLQNFIQKHLTDATEGKNAFGNALRDAIGVKVDPKELAQVTQTEALKSSTTALGLFEQALRNVSQGIGAPAGGTAPTGSEGQLRILGPDSELGAETDAFGNSISNTTDVTTDFARIVPTASDVITKLAASASGANQSLGLLPSIINLIQAATATSSASSSGGGLFGFIGGLFSGGGGAAASTGAASGTISNFLFHSGGVVGESAPIRMTASDTLKRYYYHTGGIAGQPADLRQNEVPAVLMRGEEVLTSTDPRHRRNLAPDVMDIIRAYEGRSRNEVRDILARAAGKPKQTSLVDLADMHVRGKREIGGGVSAGAMYQVNERGPELLQVAGRQYLMMGNQSGNVKPAGESKGQPVINQTVNFNSGNQPVDRRSADQLAAAASAGARRALIRNS